MIYVCKYKSWKTQGNLMGMLIKPLDINGHIWKTTRNYGGPAKNHRFFADSIGKSMHSIGRLEFPKSHPTSRVAAVVEPDRRLGGPSP